MSVGQDRHPTKEYAYYRDICKRNQRNQQGMVFKSNESIFGHILSALGVILIFPEHLNARIRLPVHVELREFSRVQQKLRVLLLIVQRDPEGSATLVRTASCER